MMCQNQATIGPMLPVSGHFRRGTGTLCTGGCVLGMVNAILHYKHSRFYDFLRNVKGDLIDVWWWPNSGRGSGLKGSALLTTFQFRALSYYSDLSLLQSSPPMGARLSKKAALPLVKILATESRRCSKGPVLSPVCAGSKGGYHCVCRCKHSTQTRRIYHCLPSIIGLE